MIKNLPCTIELSEKFGRLFPEFSLSIRFEVEKRLLLTVLDIYLYQTPGAEYYFAYATQKVTKHELYMTCIGEFNEEEIREGFRLFEKAEKLLETRKKFAIVAEELHANAIIPLLGEFNLVHANYPTVDYYMTPEQEDLLLKTQIPELPEGYELGVATADDAELITSCWKNASIGDEEQIRMLLSVFPSSCIRYKGEIAGFELVHSNGMQNHLFIFPEHRGKKLGYIVELDLARRLIKDGHFVFKSVLTSNESVLNQTDKIPFWTKRVKADGTPNLRIYIAAWREEIDNK